MNDFCISPNEFDDAKSDSAAIQTAVDMAVKRGEPVRIPAWNARTGTNLWVIDETIWLPSGSTVYIDNAHLRMQDDVFCNMFANSKAWADDRQTAESEEQEIHIQGFGNAVLDGGNYNRWGERMTPDKGMAKSYAENKGNLPKRLVHNCLIYFHNVNGFSIKNIKILRQRYWAMCCSFCENGEISSIRFNADISWVSDDGKTHDPNRWPENYNNLWIKNGDGIDLRTGCNNILIENVTGWTEDDVIALTNLPGSERVDWVDGKSTDIARIRIRNISAGCWGWMNVIRILTRDGTSIHDIDIDGVMDIRRPKQNWRHHSTMQINDSNPEYTLKERTKMGDVRNIHVANVFSQGVNAIRLNDPMENIFLENIRVSAGADSVVQTHGGAEFRNVVMRNLFVDSSANVKSIVDLHEVSGEITVSGVFATQVESVVRTSASDLKVNLSDVHVGMIADCEIRHFKREEDGWGAHWYMPPLPAKKSVETSDVDRERGVF